MSYSSHRKKASDITQHINHRVSHARSCTVCVSQKFRVERAAVIDEVLRRSGVDLNSTEKSDDLISALDVLDIIRFDGI